MLCVKLILLVVGEEHLKNITSVLMKHGYFATEIGNNGEFLQYGDAVLLLGVEDEKADQVIQVIKNEGQKLGDSCLFQNRVRIFIIPMNLFKKVNVKNK